MAAPPYTSYHGLLTRYGSSEAVYHAWRDGKLTVEETECLDEGQLTVRLLAENVQQLNVLLKALITRLPTR